MTNTTKTIGRELLDGTYVEIVCQERDGSDGLAPGFAVVGSAWGSYPNAKGRTRARMGREADSSGQIVNLIREAAPELQPLLDAHLADPDGVPMHAEANGWYFYSGAAAAYERERAAKGDTYYARLLEVPDHDRAAQALHIAPADLPAGLDREGFAKLVVDLAATWQTQAAAARAVLTELVDGAGVEDR